MDGGRWRYRLSSIVTRTSNEYPQGCTRLRASALGPEGQGRLNQRIGATKAQSAAIVRRALSWCQLHRHHGHLFELFYETTRYVPSASERPYLKNQPQRLPHGGARARQLDHLNLLSSDVLRDRAFFRSSSVFGCRSIS